MAQSVGGLIADIGLNVGGLRDDINKSNRELKKGTNRMNRHLGSMRKRVDSVTRGFKGLAAAISVAILARYVKSTIDSADKMLKLTQRLGGTTEAFSELEFVANRSGIAFNTLTMGLQRMVRRVAEAAAGFGEAKAALRELGLDANRLRSMALDKQFEVIADALFGVKSESDRVRLAMKLFDSEGVALLQTMTNGAQGIRDLRLEAQKLGVTLSQDQAEAAATAKDALTDLNAQVDALTRSMTLGLIPSITEFVTKLNAVFFPDDMREIANTIEDIRVTKERIDGAFFNFNTGPARDELKVLEDRLDSLIEKQRQLARDKGNALLFAQGDANLAGSEAAGKDAGEAFSQGYASVLADMGPLSIGGSLTADTLIPKQTADQVFPLRNIIDGAFEEIEESADDTADNIDARFGSLASSIGFSLQRSFSNTFMGIEGSFSNLLRRMAADFAASSLVNLLASFLPESIGKKLTSGIIGFKDGGSFTVGGSGGTDSQFVPFMATPGERVTVTKPGQSGGVITVNQNYNIEAGADWITLQKVLPPLFEKNRLATIAEIQQHRLDGRF